MRSVYGRESKWFQRTLTHSQGEVSAGNLSKPLGWAEPGVEVQAAVDAASRGKYGRYAHSIVDSTVTATARGVTLQLIA